MREQSTGDTDRFLMTRIWKNAFHTVLFLHGNTVWQADFPFACQRATNHAFCKAFDHQVNASSMHHPDATTT
jgi:hypothetical protein